MSSNLKILVYKNKKNIIFKFNGDVNFKVLNKMLYMLRINCNCIPKVSIQKKLEKSVSPLNLKKI